MRPNAFFLALLALTAGLPACGHNDSMTSPTPASVAGNWSGDLVVQGSAAKMTWGLSQTSGSSAVAGTVLVVLPSGTALLNGVLTGTFDGTTLNYAFVVGPGAIPSQPSCTGQVSGTAAESAGPPTILSGTFSVVTSTCTPPIQNGPFTLTKS